MSESRPWRGRALLVAGLWLTLAGGAAAAAEATAEAGGAETVVLLHGLARTDRSMRPLEERLAGAGFAVHNLRYPSTDEPPEALVAQLGRELDGCCATAGVVHFVGHSLGGLLVRAYLADEPPANVGRLVMLAPPNAGSELVDALADWAIFRAALGPTAEALGTGPDSFPNRLPPPFVEVGVIAGTESVNPIGSAVIPDEDDGTVSVASTRLEGMTDFLTVPSSHPFIMRSDEVGRQVVHFLRHGRFDHAGDE